MENRAMALEQRFGNVETTMTEVLERLNELTTRPRRRRAPSRRRGEGEVTDDEDSSPPRRILRRVRSHSRNSGSSSHHYRGGRPKLEIPVFSGDDAHDWLVHVERYFRINEVSEHDKIDVVVIALEDHALNWFQWWEEQAPSRTWEEFTTAVKRRFSPGTVNNPLGPLLSLKHDGTVTEYREKFELYVAPLKREERVMLDSIFLNGLKEEVQAEVKLYDYEDLADLMDRALLTEEKNSTMVRRNGGMKEKNEWKGSNPKFRSTWGNPKDQKESGRGSSSTVTEGGEKKTYEGVKGRRLNPAELEERSKKGLCFKCGEKWNREHVCKFKHMKLMLCEIDEGDEETDGEEMAEVAIEGEELKTLQLSLQSKEGQISPSRCGE